MVDNKYSMFTKIQRPHTLLISAYNNTRPRISRSCPVLLCVFLLKYCTYKLTREPEKKKKKEFCILPPFSIAIIFLRPVP